MTRTLVVKFLSIGVSAAGIFGVAPLRAEAATSSTVDSLFSGTMALGAGLGVPLVIAVAAIVMLMRRVRMADAVGMRARSRLEAAPVGYIMWPHDDDSGLSGSIRGFELLGLRSEDDHGVALSVISGQFDAGDRVSLADALARLSDDGAPFDGLYRTEDRRALTLAGRRDGADCLIWIADSSEQSRLSEALQAQTGEASILRGMLDLLPLPVWWRDGDLRLEGCNASYAAALDDDQRRVVAENRELAPEAREAGLARRARMAGVAMSESMPVIIDGERRLFEFTEAPLKSSADKDSVGQGTGERVGGYALDVTALENVQSELADYIAAHAEVLESLGTAIAIFGPDKRLQFFNNAFLDLWRIGRDRVADEPLLGDVLEILRARRRLPEYVDFAEHKREMAALFMTLIEPREELLHLPDERTLRMLVAPHPMGGLLFVYEDVTDRLALERSYNTLIAVQNESLNNLHEAIAVFGADGRLKLWNNAALTMWGFVDSETLMEMHIGDILEESRQFFETRSDWPTLKQRLMLSITEPTSRDGRLERLDGSILDYKCVPLPDGGCLVGYIDVSDSFRVRRALEDRNAALEQADRMKSEFIANVSYELRTPLNAIIGFTEILENRYFGELEPRQAGYVDGILAASNHLLSLINDILDLASIEAGHMTLEMAPVDIREMLDGLLESFQSRAIPDDAALNVFCPVGIGEMIADVKRLRQALYNLVANALRFTPSDGQVTISVRREGQDILFLVTDSGIGIAAEDHERVFEKFERTERGGRDIGVGLGLPLVRSLIDLHGGCVEIVSSDRTGTNVECRVPVTPPKPVLVAGPVDAANPLP
jgi:signal transduction histidine kinase